MRVQTVLYFEVNDTNPLNALEFLTESGKYFFDHIVLLLLISIGIQRNNEYI